MAQHDFPRDPRSAFNHITLEAMLVSIKIILSGVPEIVEATRTRDIHLATFLSGKGGYRILNVLTFAAACAFALGLTDDDYDAALVRQAFVDHAKYG